MTRVPREAYSYGPAVEGGVLRYVSPSALDLADAGRSVAGCLRKHWYRYVAGIREPESQAQRGGTEGHAEIERYLLTGVDGLGSVARLALHAIPKPGPDLEVEAPLVPVPSDLAWRLERRPLGLHEYAADDDDRSCLRCGKRDTDPSTPCPGKPYVDPASSVLKIEGIPVVGFRDLQHRRCLNVGGAEILEVQDPRGTVEVRDWKFTGNVDRAAKTRDEVLDATPMVAYGEAAAREALTAHVRLTHVYISTSRREPARVVSGLLPRDEVARRWEQRGPLARLIRDAAKETDVDRVDANTRACSAYRGCPHRSYCRAGQLGSLASMFAPDPATLKEIPVASVLDTLRPGALAPAPFQPAPVPVAAPATSGGPLPTTPPPNGATVATAAPQAGTGVGVGYPPSAPVVDAFAEACKTLDQTATRTAPDGVQFGWPPISGDVAQRKAALYGYAPPSPGSGYAGSGKLAALPWVSDVGQFIALARDVGDAAGLKAPAPVPAPVDPAVPVHAAERTAPWPPAAILPPDAPPSRPELAALPVTPTPQEVASGAPWVAHVQAQQAAMQQAPAVTGGPVAAQVVPVAAVEPPVAPAPKKSRGKKATAPAAPGPSEVPATVEGVYLHVDAVPIGPYSDMGDLVEEWCQTICAHYPESNGPAVDVRCSSRDELGFGKWKGVLAAFAKECARTGKIPPGNYFLRARGSDVGSVVAEALRGLVDGGSWGVS